MGIWSQRNELDISAKTPRRLTRKLRSRLDRGIKGEPLGDGILRNALMKTPPGRGANQADQDNKGVHFFLSIQIGMAPATHGMVTSKATTTTASTTWIWTLPGSVGGSMINGFVNAIVCNGRRFGDKQSKSTTMQRISGTACPMFLATNL
jgi:hypothetical protein